MTSLGIKCSARRPLERGYKIRGTIATLATQIAYQHNDEAEGLAFARKEGPHNNRHFFENRKGEQITKQQEAIQNKD